MLQEFIDKKLGFKNHTLFVSAILCGVAMGCVSTFAIVLSTMTKNVVLSKFIFGSGFSAFLFLAIINGYELFTGNTMLLTAVAKKGKTKKILLNLLFVYLGNLFGCIAIAYLIKLSGVDKAFGLQPYLANLYQIKTSMNIFKMFLLGILANYFVCMAVYLSLSANNAVDKFIRIFFPICIFCVLGFEHSIANIFSLFYASFINSESILHILVNILFVTLGNVLGGFLFAISTTVKTKKTQS